MQKVSFATLLAVALIAGLAYLAFDPSAGRAAVNWVRSQFSGGSNTPQITPTGYIPIVPGK